MDIKKKLDVIIYEKIIESLIQGDYLMGQQILLDDLVEKFQVSRTPISQATRLLGMDGILEFKTNGRLYVPSFDKDQIKQIVDVRLVLEKHALEMIDLNNNERIIEELERSAIRCEKYSEKDFLKMSMEDLNFHRILVSGADNEYLSDVYRKVQGKYIVASYLVLPPNARDNKKIVGEHFKVIECLKNKDISSARLLIDEHVYELYLQMMKR